MCSVLPKSSPIWYHGFSRADGSEKEDTGLWKENESWSFNPILSSVWKPSESKSSDFDSYETLVDKTKSLIHSFGVIVLAEIVRM